MIADVLLPYINKNQNQQLPFVADLSMPLHSELILNQNRKIKTGEVDISGGYYVTLETEMTGSLQLAIDDFCSFMNICLGVNKKIGSYFNFEIRRDDSVGDVESFKLNVNNSKCVISGSGVEGIRRALIYLEDEMKIRRFPALPVGEVLRQTAVKTRISRSPYASYRFGTGWELDKDVDAYPEEYLNRMVHCGINGIWVAGIFRELLSSKVLPEMTVSETRIDLLADLVEKAALYGIKVYFFCIEPRIQDDRDPVFIAHPEIRGSKWGNYGRTICTSHPLVLEYIEDVTAELFRKVPRLGGLINLFRGERTTACCSPSPPVSGTNDRKHPSGGRPADYVKLCPRCSERKTEDVYCDELNAFYRGMRSVSDEADLIAWNYGHNQMELNKKILDKLNPDIHFLDTFEHDGKKEIFGKTRIIDEYAISYIGPSAPFIELNSYATNKKKSLYAKIQIGTTYESASMPYVPVPISPYRKFKEMHKFGIKGVMQSWIIGGFPSIMHKAAGEASFQPLAGEEDFIMRLAAIEWGEENALQIFEAWNYFFVAYNLYPFSSPVFYFGPVAKSPAYHLYLERQGHEAKPYNWGIGRDRTIQPYEDNLEKWLGCFTAEELILSFRAMASKWECGLKILRHIVTDCRAVSVQKKELAVAEALCIQFWSCANVIEFYKLRDSLNKQAKNDDSAIYRRMIAVAEDDIKLALLMKQFIKIDSSIGFQSEMQYYSFSDELIDKKVNQSKEMLAKIAERLSELAEEKINE